MQALHERILQVLPACKLWFLDGKDSEGKTVTNPNIGSLVERLKKLSPEEWQKTAEHEAFDHYSVFIMFRHLLNHEMCMPTGSKSCCSGRTAREVIAGKGDKTMRKIMNWNPNMKTTAFFVSMLMTMLASGGVSGQQKPTTGYAPVNGLKVYYEIHGSGEPVVLLHGAFMTITNNWTAPSGNGATDWIGELSKTRKVIAVEMQGHGRTADIKRDIAYENLADDVAGLLDYLKIPSADIIGYSLGGGVAMQCAIRHPEKVRKVVSISARFRQDGFVKEGLDAFPKLTPEAFKDSPIEIEYKKLSPTPDKFADLVNHIKAMALRPFDFGADKLKATKAPMFFIHGDADGVRLDHISEMFRLKGGEIHGDLGPRSASRLTILPDTTHVTLMNRMSTIVPMVNDFLDAKPKARNH